MTDFRSLCANLTAALNDWQCRTDDDGYAALSDCARAALAQPKPPSLKEQALEALEVEDDAMPLRSLERSERFDTIRRALEALPNE